MLQILNYIRTKKKNVHHHNKHSWKIIIRFNGVPVHGKKNKQQAQNIKKSIKKKTFPRSTQLKSFKNDELHEAYSNKKKEFSISFQIFRSTRTKNSFQKNYSNSHGTNCFREKDNFDAAIV